MARGTPVTTSITDTGAVVTLAAAPVDGDIVEAGAGCFLVVDNASGGSINVTIQNPATYRGLDVADRIVAVAAGTRKHIPVPAYLRQPADAVTGPGMALVDYSAIVTVTRGVGKLVA
jgi:hypothetical protein